MNFRGRVRGFLCNQLKCIQVATVHSLLCDGVRPRGSEVGVAGLGGALPGLGPSAVWPDVVVAAEEGDLLPRASRDQSRGIL
jgi:hypothetical protein